MTRSVALGVVSSGFRKIPSGRGRGCWGACLPGARLPGAPSPRTPSLRRRVPPLRASSESLWTALLGSLSLDQKARREPQWGGEGLLAEGRGRDGGFPAPVTGRPRARARALWCRVSGRGHGLASSRSRGRLLTAPPALPGGGDSQLRRPETRRRWRLRGARSAERAGA